MRKRTSDYYSSDTEQMAATEDAAMVVGVQEEYQDVFLMRPHLYSDKIGNFSEAKQVYDNANAEVRQMLLQECSLIYECNACRNMFRNLTHFISHKRVYCRRSAVDGDGGSAGGDKCMGLSNHHSATLEETLADKTTWKTQIENSTEAEKMAYQDICEKENNEQMADVPIENNAVDPQPLYENVQEDCNGVLSSTAGFANTKDDVIHLNGNIDESIPLELAIKQLSSGYDADAVTRLKHFLSTACQTCVFCNETFEQCDELSTHLLHCPLKQSVLNGTLVDLPNETVETKRIKLQTNSQTKQEINVAADQNNIHNQNDEQEENETVKEIAGEDPKQSTSAVLIKTEIVQNNAEQSNASTALKKKRLRSRHKTVSIKNDISGKVAAHDAVLTRIKQEPSSESECNREDTEKEEPKKVKHSCAFCGKLFERRAALSTHLQNCRVKNGLLEKSATGTEHSVTNVPTNAKRSKMQTCAEKCTRESRLHAQLTATVVEDPETELLNEMFANLGGRTFGLGLRTVTLDQDDLTASTDEAKTEELTETEPTTKPMLNELNDSNANEPIVSKKEAEPEPEPPEVNTVNVAEATAHANIKTEDASPRNNRSAHAEKRLLCRCKICYKQFNALSNLRRHISMFHYRAQRFGCTLCEYRAFRRYDIVNHLGNAHAMKGDPEAMSIEFVSEHEVNYTKEDVEGDIVVLNEKDVVANIVAGAVEAKLCEKRIRRNKTISVSNGVAIGKVTRQKLKRAQSAHENVGTASNAKPLQRRPIRNRIKPVNKDFVYDLSNLLKKEHTSTTELTRTLRRRNTMGSGNAADASINICTVSLLGTADNRENIRGTAQRLLLSLVNQGLAVSATQPELPAERPQMRQRLISLHRADMHNVPVIETDELEAARMNSTLLDDTFLEKVAKGSATAFRIKPSLALQNSKISWFLEKVDSSLHNSANGKSTPSDDLCSGNANMNSSALQVSPPPSIPRATEPPPTPRKRISMLDRLTENRIKYRESLLRSALEN